MGSMKTRKHGLRRTVPVNSDSITDMRMDVARSGEAGAGHVVCAERRVRRVTNSFVIAYASSRVVARRYSTVSRRTSPDRFLRVPRSETTRLSSGNADRVGRRLPTASDASYRRCPRRRRASTDASGVVWGVVATRRGVVATGSSNDPFTTTQSRRPTCTT